MKNYFRLLIFACLTLIVGTLMGCSSYIKFVEYVDPMHPENNWLTNHRSPVVKYPALTGNYIGLYAGKPLIIPWDIIRFIPSVIIEAVEVSHNPEAFEGKGDIETAVAYAPPLVLSIVVKYAFGIPCWTLCGWWWPEQNTTRSNSLEEKKTEQPSQGTEKINTNTKSLL